MLTQILNYHIYITIALAVVIIILIIILASLSKKLNELKRRYEFFMGNNRRPEYGLEEMLKSHISECRSVNEQCGKILEKMDKLEENMDFCIQKTGVIRYNPFNEAGGNLSFSIALLDAENNGAVITGLYGRTGSFTYAKPVENGLSSYKLSLEEKQAIKKAAESGYNPKSFTLFDEPSE